VLARALLLVVTCLLAAACGGSSASPSHAPSPSIVASVPASGGPTESGPTVDEAFCGTIADLESGLQTFEAIKVKAANASKLKDAAAGVVAAVTPITGTASTDLLDLADALKTAVDGLSSATENYATASPSGKDAASKKLKKAVTTLHAAIAQLRQAAVCTPT
jgi:hypothetical protein